MSWSEATWEKDGRTITGRYHYTGNDDRFRVEIDVENEITGGLQQRFEVNHHGVSFNGWKCVRKKTTVWACGPVTIKVQKVKGEWAAIHWVNGARDEDKTYYSGGGDDNAKDDAIATGKDMIDRLRAE